MDEIFNIRYVKLKITVSMQEQCILPRYKASMLRGGIGEMLLRTNCIRDRDCEKCDFESECLVRRTMYSKFNNKPEFVTEGDSVGYVLECEAYKTEYKPGDSLCFYLILFGKTIVYFSQYLNAIFSLGGYGVGKENAHFIIERVQNSHGLDILNGNNIYMKNYRVENIRDHVSRRMSEIVFSGNGSIMVNFKSPLSIKYHGEMLEEFNPDALIRSLIRRIYLLDCFEDLDIEKPDIKTLVIPTITEQQYSHISVPRFSNRKQQKIYLEGISGHAELDEVTEDVLKLFLAGEILHVGKNTSFGFGRMEVSDLNTNERCE